MINFHCTIIPVVVLDSVIAHTSAWFLDRRIHQLVCFIIMYSMVTVYIQLQKLIYIHLLKMPPVLASRHVIIITYVRMLATYYKVPM